ncbi:unnamed protein product [Nippostrongylus brasiliensis]|uniref:PARP-type domain-containing protein n=1 Tax=Nippostrongylus brasiliensis TaxID=27835 RepID=A0A0N4YA60_NIPBR|nr:hypothetical protein Q1695_013679 [Nippostrongylus brasiliensis]VDL76841.1 unnamed protein product [Nippostrongylus brasiliensis]
MKFIVDSNAEVDVDPSLISRMVAKQKNENGINRLLSYLDVDIDALLEQQGILRRNDREPEVDPNAKLPSRCWLCKASRLRVVNIGKSGKRILECANRNCFATIEYTDLPDETVIEQEKPTRRNYGWYLRDTSEMVYPSKERLAAFPNLPFEYVPEVLYNSSKRVLIRCPGQWKLVQLQ